MRVAGILNEKRGGAIHDFLSAFRGEENVKVWTYPPEDPFLAVVAGDHQALEFAEHPRGSLAIVDGEIFNGDDLERALGSTGRSSENDATILLDLWLREGPTALDRLSCGAAITLWDAPNERLTLVRDRTGVPPVFYAEIGDSFLWASEIKTLLRAGCPRDLNAYALNAYLSIGYVPAPWTMLEAVRKVPAAHLLNRKAGNSTVERYWQPVWRPKLKLSGVNRVDLLRKHLRDALCQRVKGAEAVGVLLSSGVDSSLVAAGLCNLVQIGVVAFTFQYTDYSGKFNEFDRADLLTKHLGIPHHKISLSPFWVVRNMERMLVQYEEPFTYGLHTARLDEVQERGISVVLTGNGPDVWYVPRPDFYALKLARLSRPTSKACRTLLSALDTLSLKSANKALRLFDRASISIPELYLQSSVHSIIGSPSDLYLNPEHDRSGRLALLNVLELSLAGVDSESGQDKMAYLNQQFLAAEHSLWWTHRWGRAHGLAFRYPFFDRNLVSFLARVKRTDSEKADFRRLAATLMPRNIAYYPKISQIVPLWLWLKGPLKELVYSHLSHEELKADGLFRPQAVHQAIDAHMRGNRDCQHIIWCLLSFVIWKKLVLDNSLYP